MVSLLRRHVLENPLAARMLTTSMTGPKLGGAFLLVNIALLITYIACFAYFMEAGEIGESRAGDLLYFWQNIILYFVLALLLPLKVSGTIEGSRMGKALDQLVVTGSSPLRFFFGSWAIGMLYTLVLLLPTLPYVACATIFGGLDLVQLAGGYAILVLYANVIIAVTLALSLFEREWVTVPLTMGFFFFAGLFGVIMERDWIWGYPNHIAELTPLRLFYRQVDPFEIHGWSQNVARTDSLVYEGPYFFMLQVPLSIYPYLAWSVIFLAALAALAIGPAHQFGPGLNTFGTVTFEGDRRRRFLRAMRGVLSRRVELAFLYENRPVWLGRLELPIRTALSVLPVFFLWGMLVGRVHMGAPATRSTTFFNDEHMLGSFILCCLVLGAWILSVCDPRYRVYWRERIWKIKLPREVGLLATFVGLVLSLAAVQLWMYALARSSGGANFAAYSAGWARFASGILLLTLNVFLLSRVVSRGTHSANFSRISTVLLTLVLIGAPGLLLALAMENLVPPAFLTLGAMAPVVLVDEIHNLPWDPEGRFARFAILHSILAVGLLSFLGLCHCVHGRLDRMRARRGAARATAVGAALLSAVVLGAPARAQEEAPRPEGPPPIPGLVVEEVSRGFDGITFSEPGDFITCVIRNDGADAIEGDFWIDFATWSTEPQRFELGPGTTRVLRWSGADPVEHRILVNAYNAANVVFESAGRRTESGFSVVQVIGPHQNRFRGGNTQQYAPHSFVLVGKKEKVSRRWVEAALGNEHEKQLAACRPRSLPEHAIHYFGVSAVLVGPIDLSTLSARQRNALYDYVRLGGSVVFFGGLDRCGAAGAGPWNDILSGRRSRKVTIGESLFHVEELENGRNVLEMSDPTATSTVPLLNVRRVGPGSVAHLSFDFEDPHLPAGQTIDVEFWQNLSAATPLSVFPFLVTSVSWRYDGYLWDVSSMLTIGGYFLVYTLVYGLGLMIFFRKRKRREKLWVVVAAIPFLFLIGIPLLNRMLHARPSLGELYEMVYVAPGVDEATTFATLRLRSSGRQQHAINVRGDDPRALALEYQRSYNPSVFLGSDLPLTPAGDDEYELSLPTPPWAGRSVYLIDTTRTTPPASGTVKIDRRRRTVSYSLDDLEVDPFEVSVMLYLFNVASAETAMARIAPAGPDAEFSGTLPFEALRTFDRHSHLQVDGNTFALTWTPTQPRALLIWVQPEGTGTLRLSSADLAFEREIAEDQARRLRRRGGYAHEPVERDGRFYRNFRHRVIVRELDLEFRR